MRSGQLDRQITIQRKQVTQDAHFGTEVVTWVPLAVAPGQSDPSVGEKFWAEIVDVLPSRAESVALGLNVARNQLRLRMRYRDDIDSSMRVLLHGDGADQVLQIVAGPANVFKDGRKTLIEFVCERWSS